MRYDIASNSELKDRALDQLRDNWTTPVLATLVLFILTGLLETTPMLKFSGFSEFLDSNYEVSILSILLSGALSIGFSSFFLKFVRDEEFEVSDIFDGFKQFVPALIVGLLITAATTLGFAFLIIPGIVIAMGLSMTYNIMADNPGTSAVDAMKKSWAMTDGYKWKIFCLNLSFIGWAILSIFTLFIGLLWLVPYIAATNTNLYLELKEIYEEKEHEAIF